MSNLITPEDLKELLPRGLHGNATQELADKINGAVSDPIVAKEIRENFISYTRILSEGRFKTEDYLNAVVYASHKLMGYSNQDAYQRTFPDRYSALVARGASKKDISAYVAMYHKNKLVNMLLEQAMVPVWVLNQDAFQKAINTQLEIMSDDTASAKARVDAANSILTHLKPPEVKKFELDIGVRNDGGIAELRETMAELARTQKMAIENGAGAKQIVSRPLNVIDAEVVSDSSG